MRVEKEAGEERGFGKAKEGEERPRRQQWHPSGLASKPTALERPHCSVGLSFSSIRWSQLNPLQGTPHSASLCFLGSEVKEGTIRKDRKGAWHHLGTLASGVARQPGNT